MLAVLSPAKSLDYETQVPAVRTTQPSLLDDAETLVGRLRKLAPHELSELMHISDKLGELNFDRYQSWRRPFTKKNARAAVLTFNGDVYQGLQASAMSQDELAFAQQHLRILSGLYGVLKPLDLMQPYRLEMGTRLVNERGSDLYSFWGRRITEELNAQLKRAKAKALINLASHEYFRSVQPKHLKAPVIEPVFKERRNGKLQIISFFAKKARGQMAAYLIRERLANPEALKQFDTDGYRFAPELSNAQKWVFTRDGESR